MTTAVCSVEPLNLELPARIGTYGPDDVVPESHTLDLTLSIASDWVLIATDDMANVFDYDPLLAEIERLAREGHYQTQERLITKTSSATFNNFSTLVTGKPTHYIPTFNG